MKKSFFTIVLVIASLFMMNLESYSNNNAGPRPGPRGPMGQNNRPSLDSMEVVELSGTIIIDTTFRRVKLFLDTDGDSQANALLNFGPPSYEPEGQARPEPGESVTIKGYSLPRRDSARFETIEYIVLVTELNGEIWRDSSTMSSFREEQKEKFQNLLDSLETYSGIVITDTCLEHGRLQYFLDTDGDEIADYHLGFGPINRIPADILPAQGDSLTIEGFIVENPINEFDEPTIAVFKINGELIRGPRNRGPHHENGANQGSNSRKIENSCFPNPFNPKISIQYYLQEEGQTRITIYNMTGQKVKTLLNEHQASGLKRVVWNAKNDHGTSVGAGTYIYVISQNGVMASNKIFYLK